MVAATRTRARNRGIPEQDLVLLLQAADGKKGEYLRDLTGRGHDAQFGSVGSARVMEPIAGNPGYLRLPGVTGNYASVPDEAALDITGDIDLRVAVALNDWTPATNNSLLSKAFASGSESAYGFTVVTTGVLRGVWYEDGSTVKTIDSTVAPAINNGELLLVRFTLDVDNGAGGHDVKFHTKASTPSSAAADLAADTGWTQLGATITTAGTTSIHAGAHPLQIGANTAGAGGLFGGRILAAIVKDGIDGATVLDVDFTDLADGATSFVCETGQTVTITSASGTDAGDPAWLQRVTSQYAYLPGVMGNSIFAPNTNLLDTRQASFDNVALDPLVSPEDRYEVWGSGGGTGAGTPGAASPFLVDLESYDVAAGLDLAGTVTTDYAYTADHPRLDITGDLELGGKVKPRAWAQGGTSYHRIITKYGGSAATGAYSLYITSTGGLSLYLSNGTTHALATSTASVSFSDGDIGYVKATYRKSDRRVQFFESIDGVTWTQVGLDVTHTIASINASAAQLQVGTFNSGEANAYFDGVVYEAWVRNGIDGPLVANPRFEGAHIAGGVGSLRDGQGNVWTLNGNAAIASGAPSQVGWLPGAANNYLSIADTNLLNARHAHFHSAIPPAISNINASAGHNTVQALFGGGSLRHNSNTGGYSSLIINEIVPAVAGTQYTYSIYVRADFAGADAKLRVQFRQGTTTLQEVGSGQVAVAQGRWVQLKGTGIAPANTDSVRIILEHFNGASSADGVNWDAACFRTGSDPTFLPSHRIVGDLDLRARVALKDWTPGTPPILLGKFHQASEAPRAYWFIVNTDGTLRLGWYNSAGTLTNINSTVVVPVADREDVYLRVTMDVDNGASGHDVKFYTSADGTTWTQLGTTVTIAGTTEVRATSIGFAFGGEVTGATNFTQGVYLWSEVRDGVDGPVVASTDLTKQLSPSTTTDTTPEGHTVTLNRSGDATAEIVDRDAFVFTGAERLVLAARAEFNVGASGSGEALEMFALNYYTPPGDTNYEAIFGTHTGFLNEGFHFGRHDSIQEWAVDSHDGSARQIQRYGPAVPVRDWTPTRAFISDTGQAIGDMRGAISTGTARPPGSIVGSSDVGIGAWASGGIPLRALMSCIAVFRRTLTAAEQATLAAWDGSVATEPVWMRPLAIFYANANDPNVKASYATNEVLNLATLPYGDLGWTVQKLSGTGPASIHRSSPVAPPVGSMLLQLDVGASGQGGAAAAVASVPVGPVTPGLTYSASLAARLNAGSAGYHLDLVFFDAAGGELARTSSASAIASASAGFQRAAVEAVAPAGAALVGVEFVSVSTWASYYIDAVVVRQGADAGYIPSLRVREDLDVRVRVQCDDWTPATLQGLAYKWSASNPLNQRSYAFLLDTNGTLGLALSLNGTTNDFNSRSTVATGLTDGGVAWVRATYDASSGIVTFYTSTDDTNDPDAVVWVQLAPPSREVQPVFTLEQHLWPSVPIARAGTS